MKKILVFSMMLALGVVIALAQGQGSRQMPPGQNVAGKVTAVSADSVTVAPVSGGDSVIVKVGDSTRIFKERQPVKLSDIKVNDTVFARGQQDGNTMNAAILAVVNPEMLERMQQGGGMGMGRGAGGGMGQFKPEDWGKTFIAGQVKAINETTLTIARPNDQQQTVNIEVDENTSFRKGRESVTLADIKPNDFVMGPGEVKNGVFVAKELRVRGEGGGFMMRSDPGNDQKKPDSDKPASPPKN